MLGRLQGILLTCPISTIGVQGMVIGIAVDLSVLFYLLRPLPGPHRAGVPGRLVLVGSDCASRRRAVSKGSVYPRSETWVGVGSVVGQAFRSERRAGVRSEAFRSERRARVGSGRRSFLAWPSGRRLDRPSGLSSRYFGPAHELRVARNVVCWAEPLLESRSMRDPGFMNPTGAPEPPGDSGRIV